MTYHEAIEAAKKLAGLNNENFIVFRYKFHWWQRRKYDRCSQFAFNEVSSDYSLVKLLTITPTGVISQ